MTHADATTLATRIAHDLAGLTPLATRFAVVSGKAPEAYYVTAKMDTACHDFGSPEAWTAHVATWTKAQKDAAAKRAKAPVHGSVLLLIMLTLFVGLPVGFLWLYVHSPLLRFLCFVVFGDERSPL